MKNKEELLDLYLDNELSEDQEKEFNTLLNTDSTFRREVELMKKIKDESKDLPKMNQTESFKLNEKRKSNFSFKHFSYGIVTATLAIFIGMNGLEAITQGGGNFARNEMAFDMATSDGSFGDAGESVESAMATEESGLMTKDAMMDDLEEGSDEKFIYNAYMNLELDDIEANVNIIKSIIKDHNAYIQNINSYTNPGYVYYEDNRKVEYPDTEHYYMTIRIPKDNLDQVVQQISDLGEVTNYNKSASNVTDWYTDIESRLELQETKLERLNALLEAADNMSDLITLENSVSDTIYQIESLQSQLNRLDKDIEYSTLSINIQEVIDAELTINERNIFKELADTFIYSLDSFATTVLALAKGLIYLIPYGVILGIAYFIIRLIRKRK
jgi:hypothetical protein